MTPGRPQADVCCMLMKERVSLSVSVTCPRVLYPLSFFYTHTQAVSCRVYACALPHQRQVPVKGWMTEWVTERACSHQHIFKQKHKKIQKRMIRRNDLEKLDCPFSRTCSFAIVPLPWLICWVGKKIGRLAARAGLDPMPCLSSVTLTEHNVKAVTMWKRTGSHRFKLYVGFLPLRLRSPP